MRNLPPQQLLDSLKVDLDWELSWSIDAKIGRGKYARAFVSCFYPRTLACFTLFGGILHRPKMITQRHYSHNLLDITKLKSLTYKWKVKNAAKILAMFPNKFVMRKFKDGLGNVNFDPGEGTLAGGRLIPLIDKRNVFVMTYDYYKQKLKFNFLVKKEQCVTSRRHGVKFTQQLV